MSRRTIYLLCPYFCLRGQYRTYTISEERTSAFVFCFFLGPTISFDSDWFQYILSHYTFCMWYKCPSEKVVLSDILYHHTDAVLGGCEFNCETC